MGQIETEQEGKKLGLSDERGNQRAEGTLLQLRENSQGVQAVEYRSQKESRAAEEGKLRFTKVRFPSFYHLLIDLLF